MAVFPIFREELTGNDVPWSFLAVIVTFHSSPYATFSVIYEVAEAARISLMIRPLPLVAENIISDAVSFDDHDTATSYPPVLSTWPSDKPVIFEAPDLV